MLVYFILIDKKTNHIKSLTFKIKKEEIKV